MDSEQVTWFQFVGAPAFSRFREDYLDDDGFAGLQSYLAKNPEAGDMVPGAGGIRKLRWKDPRRGKGRRGGLRVIYYCFLSEQEIWLLTLYDKDEAAFLQWKMVSLAGRVFHKDQLAQLGHNSILYLEVNFHRGHAQFPGFYASASQPGMLDGLPRPIQTSRTLVPEPSTSQGAY